MDEDTPEALFVLPEGNSSENVTECLSLAFEKMQEAEMSPSWVKSEDCLKLKSKNNKLYICDPFHGAAFDHLVSLGVRLQGPLCVLKAFQEHDRLPRRPNPVFSLTFRNIFVTCTGLTNEVRTNIQKKIELMGGFYLKDLTKSVTHVIAEEVGSKKYHVASNFKLPVMLPQWVKECWDKGQYELLPANSPLYMKYRCPIFKGLCITVSQIDLAKRKQIQKLVEDNGGKYSGAMKAGETTHLIIPEPKGEKYKYATQWHLHCVIPRWIEDSVDAGYSLDETHYKLTKSVEKETSTPKSNGIRPAVPLSIDCSSISNASVLSAVNETMRSEASVIFQKPCNVPISDALDSIDIEALQRCGQFLDGCNIFLWKFSIPKLEKVLKIINTSGGMRFSHYMDSVTHVIVGEKLDNLAQIVSEKGGFPHVVKLQWLIECCKEGKLVNESLYTCKEFALAAQDEPDHTLIDGVYEETVTLNKPGISSSSSNKTLNRKLSFGQNLSRNSSLMNGEPDQTDFSDIIQQYKADANDNTNVSKMNGSRTSNEQTSVPSNHNATNDSNAFINNQSVENYPQVPYVNNNSSVQPEESSKMYENTADSSVLFNGIGFHLFGFESSDAEVLQEMVINNGGILISADELEESSIIIVPLIGMYDEIQVGKVLSNCWLQMCVEQERFLPPDSNSLFQPISVNFDCKPLNGCVLCFSQYAEPEKDCLVHLAELLGAKSQEYFVRKENKKRSLFPSTHLVIEAPEGNKYEAAKKWNIPTVTKEWLLECARTGKKVDITLYLSDRSILSTFETKKGDAVLEAEHDHEKLLATTIQHVEPADKVGNKSTVENSVEAGFKTPLQTPRFSRLNLQTPLSQIKSNRIKELIREGGGNGSPYLQKDSSSDDITPSRYLDTSTYIPKFNLEGAMKVLDDSISRGSQEQRRFSTPLEVVCSRNMKLALQNLDNDFSFGSNTSLSENVFSPAKQTVTTSETSDKVFAEPISKKPRGLSMLSSCRNVQNSVNSSGHTVSGDKSVPAPASESQVFVSKQLDELLSAASIAKAGKRKSRQLNSTSASPVESVSSPARQNSHPWKPPLPESEASQGVAIGWDDPTRRLEREKIKVQLEQPEMNTQSQSPADDLLVEEPPPEPDVRPPSECQVDSEAFEAISEQSKRHMIFMLSGFSESGKIEYANKIQELGGIVSQQKNFDPSATHLILDNVLKNEKFICGVACGLWVLHKSFIEDSETVGHFIDELDYEWGGPRTEEFVEGLPDRVAKLAYCPNRWRLKINSELNGKGAYSGWKVMVFTSDKVKSNTYQRMLKFGGAEVLPADPKFYGEGATHAFIDLPEQKIKMINIKDLMDNKVLCVKPEYIAFYLLEDPPPPAEKYFVSEAFEILETNQKKRLTIGSSENPIRRKRSRR